MTPRRFALPAALLALALVPATASAATVQVSGGVASYVGAPGESNSLTVTNVAGNLVFVDLLNAITVGTGCSGLPLPGTPAVCAGATSAAVDLGDKDDTLTFGGDVPSTLLGGAGNDSITGGAAADVIDGGLGADTMNGGGGVDTVDYSSRTANVTVVSFDNAAGDGEKSEADKVGSDIEGAKGGKGSDILFFGDGNGTIEGGTGNDVIDGGAGSDTLRGGDGTDIVSYALRTAAVNVSLDNLANDGEPGENDAIASDVEGVVGGSGNDTISGSGAANILLGIGGNDSISGGDGNDLLAGGAGSDVLSGGAGMDQVSYADHSSAVSASLDGVANDGSSGENDSIATDVEAIAGGSGNDTLTGDSQVNALDGGAGADLLDGGAGADALRGGAGDDVIHAKDSTVDDIACADGSDTVDADDADKVAKDCEKVARPTVTPVVPVETLAPSLTIASTKVDVTKRRNAAITVSCPQSATDGCHGTMTVRRTSSSPAIGTARYTLGFGGRKQILVKLSKASYAKLLKARRMRVRVVAVTRNGSQTTTTSRWVTLRAPKR